MENKIGKVIAVSSGKGGVGKSFVSAMLAVSLNRKGYKVGIMDADITGPSIPKMFGVKGGLMADQDMNLIPPSTSGGIKLISVNFLLENEADPVIWRGPVLANMIKQFWSQTAWGELDFLIIDMPPGTGDIPLTVYQTIPVNGTVVVTAPQDLVRLIVTKAVGMAEKMNVHIYGLVENYSYMECPDCKKKLYPFGESKMDEIAEEMGIPVLGKLPIMSACAKLADEGRFEEIVMEEKGWIPTEFLI